MRLIFERKRTVTTANLNNSRSKLDSRLPYLELKRSRVDSLDKQFFVLELGFSGGVAFWISGLDNFIKERKRRTDSIEFIAESLAHVLQQNVNV